jgi:hypothetical protein
LRSYQDSTRIIAHLLVFFICPFTLVSNGIAKRVNLTLLELRHSGSTGNAYIDKEDEIKA